MRLALDLEDYHLSVLLHCWLGHLTCKIVSEMTYNVSCGTLNPTIPYCVGRHRVDNTRRADNSTQWGRADDPDARLTDVVRASAVQLLRHGSFTIRRRRSERHGSQGHRQTGLPAAWRRQPARRRRVTWRGLPACHGAQVVCWWWPRQPRHDDDDGAHDVGGRHQRTNFQLLTSLLSNNRNSDVVKCE